SLQHRQGSLVTVHSITACSSLRASTSCVTRSGSVSALTPLASGEARAVPRCGLPTARPPTARPPRAPAQRPPSTGAHDCRVPEGLLLLTRIGVHRTPDHRAFRVHVAIAILEPGLTPGQWRPPLRGFTTPSRTASRGGPAMGGGAMAENIGTKLWPFETRYALGAIPPA